MTIPVESLREIGGNRGRKSGTDGTFSDICLTRLVWLKMIGDFQRRETSRLSPGSPGSPPARRTIVNARKVSWGSFPAHVGSPACRKYWNIVARLTALVQKRMLLPMGLFSVR